MNIATIIAAWVGAIGTIGLTFFEIYKYFNNKAKVKFNVGSGFRIVGSTLEGKMVDMHPEKEFWSITVSNAGGKKVTITQITVERNDTEKMSMLTRDFHGPIDTYTLKPGGKNRTYTITEELIPFKNAKAIYLMDSTGKVYKHKIDHKRSK